MSTVVQWKKKWLLLGGIFLGCLLYLLISCSPTPHKTRYSIWPEFDPASSIDSAYFSTHCVKGGNYSITGLKDIVNRWANAQTSLCRVYYQKFSSIFTLTARKATLRIPGSFQEKVRKWLANNEDLFSEVYNQDAVHIVNYYTREHNIYNPLRDKRPMVPPDQPESQYYEDLLKNTAETCDFCKFKEFTAEHVFGRVESKYAFSASNIFKMDSMHAIVALKKHDPLQWDLEEFLDLFQLMESWLNKAHSSNPTARYPALIWDVLPKCGASQVHPHLQVLLDSDRHHGEIEAWRMGAHDYYKAYKANYFSDLVAVYTALNLTVSYGTAIAFPNLVPKKDHEVVVMAKEPNSDFYILLYFVLRAFVDDLHKMCYSMGMGLPAKGIPEGKIPIYARVVTRGYVTDIRSDISSFEMFLASNVNTDPYRTIEILRQSLARRSNSVAKST